MSRWPALILLAACAPCHAVLGEDAGSIQQDALNFGGTLREERIANQRTVVLTTPAGLTVRQWINADGKVFALTWAGPVMPDLARLLGAQYDTLKTESQRPGPGRSMLSIATPQLMLESAGRMRAYRGRAWVPALLPAGITPQEIQ